MDRLSESRRQTELGDAMTRQWEPVHVEAFVLVVDGG